jgi:hypothetical protein
VIGLDEDSRFHAINPFSEIDPLIDLAERPRTDKLRSPQVEECVNAGDNACDIVRRGRPRRSERLAEYGRKTAVDQSVMQCLEFA